MDNAVEINDLTVVFPSPRGRIVALDKLSLRVGAGQVVGFLGPNGAGKTTAIHVLLGFVSAASGHARIFGQDVRHTIARQRIGYLPEYPAMYRFMTGREQLTLAARLFRMKGRPLRDRVETVLGFTGMTSDADRRIGTYSRGMLQRLGLAQALVNDPDLVILDEPTGGLDPIGRLEVRKIIAALRDRGKTVFFSSHELSEVELVCNHVIIMARGRKIAEGLVSDLVTPGESLERYFMKIVSPETPDNTPVTP